MQRRRTSGLNSTWQPKDDAVPDPKSGWAKLRAIHGKRMMQKIFKNDSNRKRAIPMVTKEDVDASNVFFDNIYMRYADNPRALKIWGDSAKWVKAKDQKFPSVSAAERSASSLSRLNPAIRDMKAQWDADTRLNDRFCDLILEPVLGKTVDRLFDEIVAKVQAENQMLEVKKPVVFEKLRTQIHSREGVRHSKTAKRLGTVAKEAWAHSSPQKCNPHTKSKIERMQRQFEAARPRARPQTSLHAEKPFMRSESTPAIRPKSVASGLFTVTSDGVTTYPYSIAAHKGALRAFGTECIAQLKKSNTE